MTITRVKQMSFELGSKSLYGDSYPYQPSGQAWTIAVGAGKTGSYSLGIYKYHGVVFNIPTTDQIRVSFSMYQGGSHYSSSSPVHQVAIRNAEVTTSTLGSIGWISGGRILQLRNSGVVEDIFTSVQPERWYHYGLDFKRHATSGWFYFYLDGVEVMSFDGNTGSTSIKSLCLGNYPGIGTYISIWTYFDDLIIEDSTGEASPAKISNYRYTLLKPNGVGNYTNWGPSAGSNYECVDEIPPLLTSEDFVAAGATALKDSYALEDLSIASSAEIQSVIPHAVTKKESAEDMTIKLGTRLSSTDLQSSGLALPTSYGPNFPTERQTTKPGGGAWSDADVDATEVLIESAGTYT